MKFIHTHVTISALRTSISDERLEKYLTESGGDHESALYLYQRNTNVSEAFYAPLQAFEITLRNKLNIELTRAYGSNWFDLSGAPLDQDARDSVSRAIADLVKAKPLRPITAGPIVAELSLGFWVGLLGPRYDQTLYRKALFKAFSANGKHLRRSVIHGRLNLIRRFRNRIAHHEPIFQRNLHAVYNELMDATEWLCPITAAWARLHSRVPEVLAAPLI